MSLRTKPRFASGVHRAGTFAKYRNRQRQAFLVFVLLTVADALSTWYAMVYTGSVREVGVMAFILRRNFLSGTDIIETKTFALLFATVAFMVLRKSMPVAVWRLFLVLDIGYTVVVGLGVWQIFMSRGH